MKFLPFALISTQLFAAALDPRLLNLIPANARRVSGVDIERHQRSALDSFYPFPGDHLRIVKVDQEGEDPSFFVVTGGAMIEDNRTLNLGNGDQFLCLCPIVPNNIAELYGRRDLAPSPIAVKAQQLAGTYDNWFVIPYPIDYFTPTEASKELKLRQDLADSIEEISGGLRFGANVEVHVEALMRSDSDAKSLVATLSPLLPLLVETLPEFGPLAPLAEVAENVSFNTQGRVITLTFQLPELKLAELAARLAQPR